MGLSGRKRILAAYIIAPGITIVAGLLIVYGVVLSVRVADLRDAQNRYSGILENWNSFQSESTSLVFLTDPRSGYTSWARSRDQFLTQCTVCLDPDSIDGLIETSEFLELARDISETWQSVAVEVSRIEAMIQPDSAAVERLRLSNAVRNMSTRSGRFVRALGRFKDVLNSELARIRARLNQLPLILGVLLVLVTLVIVLVRRQLWMRENRQLQALDAMREGVVITDPSGRISFVNQAAAELYSWDRSVVTGHLLEDEAPRLDALDANADTVSHADADGRTIECSIRAIGGWGSSSNGTIYVLRDLTDFLDQNARDERARQLEGIGSLAGTIAHEFNNILGGMLGSISLMETDVPPERRMELLSSLRTGISRARKLSNRLMVFSAGHTPTRIPVSLHELLSHEIREFEFPEDIDCALIRSAGDRSVHANPEQLGEVFRAVLQNAVEAMDGHGSICISTEASGDDETNPGAAWMSVLVDDCGPGIEPAVAARAFDPFYTTHEGRRGIGLSLAYQVVSAHDGDISIANRPDAGGCRVRIHLPAVHADSR